MCNLERNAGLLVDYSLPRGLHHHLADQLLLAQMGDQDCCPERSDCQDMDIKQPESNGADPFRMMRKTGCCGDQNVLHQQQSDRKEIRKTQVLELVYKRPENVLRSSQN